MVPLKQLFQSTLGKKYLMGISGLALGAFIILHLVGNLTLLASDSVPFNTYAEKLHSLGPLLILMEWGLVAVFGLHIVSAVQVTLSKKSAKPIGYESAKTKGGPSVNTIGSRNMIISGAILLAFLILHIIQFRFGPGLTEGYTTQLDGEEVRDLYKLVVEVFSDLKYVVIYSASMIFLGFHLRHGYWSAFQSLGLMNPRISKPIYAAGLGLAILLAVGFIFIPVYIYVKVGGAT